MPQPFWRWHSCREPIQLAKPETIAVAVQSGLWPIVWVAPQILEILQLAGLVHYALTNRTRVRPNLLSRRGTGSVILQALELSLRVMGHRRNY